MSTRPSASIRLYPVAEESPKTSATDTVDDSLAQQFAVASVAGQPSGQADDVDKGLKTAARQLMQFRLDSLYPILQSSPAVFQALNSMLREHHRVTVAGVGTDDNGEKYIVFNQYNQKFSVRQCRWDREMYSLKETLEWVLNKRRGSIQWALEFWVRDFQ